MDRWSNKMVALHWVSVALVVGLLGAGFVMADLPPDAALKRTLGQAHSLGGLTLGVLTLTRLVVRMTGPRPQPLPLAPWHRRATGAVHFLLYVGLFGLGASGVGTAWSSSWPAFLLGSQPAAPALEGVLSRQVHGALALGLLALVLGHVGGVVLHQVRQGGALERMLPGRSAAPEPRPTAGPARADE